MDNKFIFLTIALLSGCTIQAPTYAPTLAEGAGAYKLKAFAPVEDTSFNQPSIKIIDNSFVDKQEKPLEEPIVVAGSPFTVSTVATALYPITRGKNLTVDTQNSAGNPSSYSLSGKKYNILPFSAGYKENGIASWYGPDFHGKKNLKW